MRRTAFTRSLVVLSLAVPGAFLTAGSSTATEALAVDATASADGLRVTTVVPAALATGDTLADVGVPSSSVRINSGGQSLGYAAFPRPGDLIDGGLTNVGGLVPPLNGVVPDYPLSASSSHPTKPDGSARQGPASVTATSTESASRAQASSDGGSVGLMSSADTNVKVFATRATAKASTTVRGFAVGPLVVGAVTTTAEGVRTPEGLSTKSSISVQGLAAGGMRFGIDESGLTVAGTHTPLPDTSAIRSLLEQANIKIGYIAAQKTKTGILAASILVSTQQHLPAIPGVAFQEATVRYQLGLASITIAGARFTESPTSTPASGTAQNPASAPSTSPAQTLTELNSPDRQATTQAPEVGAERPPQGAGEAQRALPASLSAPIENWSLSFYLILVAAAGLVLLSLQAIRLLGVSRA